VRHPGGGAVDSGHYVRTLREPRTIQSDREEAAMTWTPDSNPDPFLDAMRRSQEAALNAFEAWTQTVQQPIGQAPQAVNPNQVVDQFFDFATEMLKFQREFAKTLVGASRQAVEAARSRSGEGGVAEGG
jgi:hypothetical protein